MIFRSKRFQTITFIIFLCMTCEVSGAPAGNSPDAYARSLLTSQHVPGAAIAVVRDGVVLKEIIFGSANLQLGVPVQHATKFQLASVTKVFSVVALLKLEQDGKLSLDDPVSKYLSALPKQWGDVTLGELATHTSGLPDIVASPNQPLSEAELNRSADEALRDAATRPVSAPPGARFQYDQTNYLLLKRVIEHVSGQSFRQFVTTRVLNPPMPETSWGDARSIVPGRSDMYTALYHDRIENGANLFQYPEYLDSAAGLNSNIADMEQFASLLTSGGLLSSSELDRMWQPARNRSGKIIDISKDMELPGVAAPTAGWFYADNSGGRYPRVFMAGGSAASILVFPRQRLCIVVLTNLQAKDDPLPVAEGIAKFYLPDLQTLF
ncbi:MAG: serine hydrolase domain-containing protein [Bryobacteraceae bacterium]